MRVAGVRVGQVTQVELTPDAARIKMEIQDYIELPENTRLEVKLKTLKKGSRVIGGTVLGLAKDGKSLAVINLSGTVFVEALFRIPGLGLYFTTAAASRDMPLLMAGKA